MTNLEGNKSLAKTAAEIESFVPDGLKYFMAVDFMVQGIKPIDGKYFDILVYPVNQDQPAVQILRIENKYLDQNVGKQDEIGLSTEEKRWQFNAECDPNGQYISYPKVLRPESSDFLTKVVDTFTELANNDGSKIRINHSQVLVSRNGVWEPFNNSKKITSSTTRD